MKIEDLLYESNQRVLKTQKGSPIKRAPKYGVGKDIGGALYVHTAYEDVLPDITPYKTILVEQYPEFEYNIVKYTPKSVTFLYSPDFDSSHEPLVSEYVTVKEDGTTKKGTSKTIYHHKWLFVKDDYSGFNVEDAFERSRAWLTIPDINFRKIGSSRDYWLSFLSDNKEHLPNDFKIEP